MTAEINDRIQLEILVEINNKSEELGGNTPVNIDLDDPTRKLNFEFLDRYRCNISRKRIFASKKSSSLPLSQKEIDRLQRLPPKTFEELRRKSEIQQKTPKPMPCGLTPFGHEFLFSLREKLRNQKLRETEVINSEMAVRSANRANAISLLAVFVSVVSLIFSRWPGLIAENNFSIFDVNKPVKENATSTIVTEEKMFDCIPISNSGDTEQEDVLVEPE